MPGGDVIRDPAPRRRRRGEVARHRERRQSALRDAQPGKNQRLHFTKSDTELKLKMFIYFRLPV